MKRILALCVLVAGCDLPSGSLPPSVTAVGAPSAPQPATTYGLNLLVLGKDGAPVTSPTTVQLVLDSATRALGLGLSTSALGNQTDSLELTTDARGLVPAWVTFGGRPGHAVIQARSASVGLDQQIAYDLPAGTVSTLDVFPVVPPYVGDTASIIWRSYNASAQPVFAEVAIDLSNPSLGTLVSPTQLVAATTGSGWVRGTAGAAHDSVPLAVVPHGRVGAVNAGQWTEFDLNGTANTTGFVVGAGFDSPRYSPSGDSLAYAEGGHIRLRAGTAAPVTVVPAALGFTSDLDPTWSADGQWIYFTAVLVNTNSEIWRIHPDGTGAVRVGPAAGPSDRDLQPSVNPAGTLLAVMTNRTLAGGNFTVRIINIGTGATVYQGPAGGRPVFEPSTGATVAFLSAGQVMLVNADGSGLHSLDPSLNQASGQLDWMNTGRWIIVYSLTSQGPYLHLVDAAANTSIRLPYAFARTLPSFR